MKPLKIIALFVVLFCCAASISAQNLSKYYTSRHQPGGTLYFFYPNEDYRNRDTRAEIIFDVTYRQGSDTVVVNFSTFTAKPQRIDSIHFLVDGNTTTANARQLFLDFEKKRWQNRYTAIIPYEAFHSFIHASAPPEIMVSSDGGADRYTIKPRHWRRYAEAVKMVLLIIGSADQPDQ
jgi:hypothetical protein